MISSICDNNNNLMRSEDRILHLYDLIPIMHRKVVVVTL